MDKTLIFVACCLSAVCAQFPLVCELECVSGYIGDIVECRIEFPYKPGTANKNLELCLLEVEHDRNVCMVMNRDPLCKQKAPTATLHKPFEMNLNQPITTTTPMTTTTTTTPPPRTAAPVQVGPALSQPSQSPNRLVQLFVDPSNSRPQYRHHGLVGKPSFFAPVALEPMPMQPPAGLTAAQTYRHNRIQNMIQRTVPQAMNPRPLPSPRKMQLPSRPLPKQMQLPGQNPRPMPQASNVQQHQQPQSIARTNPRIIQKRLTVFKLAKPYQPSPINRPIQPSFSSQFHYTG